MIRFTDNRQLKPPAPFVYQCIGREAGPSHRPPGPADSDRLKLIE
jgi:hypothetical protein